MAQIFKRPNISPQQVNGIRVTKSLYGSAIPIWYGRTRGATQLIYAGPVKKHTHGKKGKGGTTYTAPVDLLLGFGPMQGVGAFWVNTNYYQGQITSETFVTGTGTSFSHTISSTPANNDMAIVIGVTAMLPFSVTYNDYGGPGSQSFSGTAEVPLPNQLYPAPNSGDWQYSNIPYAKYNSAVGDTLVQVVFPTSVTGVTVTIYFMYGVHLIDGQPYYGGIYESELGNSGSFGGFYQDFSGVGFPGEGIDLGSMGTMPNLSYEGYGLFSQGPTGDANPADVVADLICSGTNLVQPLWNGIGVPPIWQHGLNFTRFNPGLFSGSGNPAYTKYGGILDDEPNLWGPGYGGGANAGLNLFRNFCQSYGIVISRALDTQTQASQILDTLMDITQSAACWDGAQLKIIPYAEASNVGNGASYVSPTAAGPVYTFSDDNYFQKDPNDPKPPVQIKRSRPETDYNSLTINFTDRKNGQTDPSGHPNGGGSYNQNSVIVTDQADVMTQGPVPGQTKDFTWVHDLTVATNLGGASIRRNVIVKRKRHTWTGQPKSCLLSLMDLVLLTDEALPNSPFPVRIVKIKDNPDNTVDYEGETFVYGASNPAPPQLTPQTGSGSPPVNQNASPGVVNTPIFIETIPAMTTKPQIGICLSGVNPNYGGCNIWLSTDGGSTYNPIGRQYGNQTMGLVYSSNYPSHADPDGTNTLNVDLTQSVGTLASFTTGQRDGFQSLCYLSPGGTVTANGVTLTIPYELVAYATANLSAANKYALVPTIRRGVYGTPIAAHNIGQQFSFLNDGLVFYMDMLQSYIGVTLHFKFTAFNTFGLAEQQLSAATDYTFTPSGSVGWTWSAGGTPVGTTPYPTGGVNPSVPPVNANDLYSYAPGGYTAGQELVKITPSRLVNLPVNLTASVATCDAAPTNNVNVAIAINGTNVGVVTFASGATTGSFTMASPHSLNGTGDYLTLTAPATADLTFAGASITLWATRSN